MLHEPAKPVKMSEIKGKRIISLTKIMSTQIQNI